jgi:glycosyltransferase involved in cell wall biosynthesis
LKFIRRIVAISGYVKRRWPKIPGTNAQEVVVIYNGVNLNRFTPSTKTNEMKKRFEIPSENKVITIVAHLIPEKGVDYFLEAAKLLLASEKALTFLVVGKGILQEKLLDLTNRLGINKNVRFLGLRDDTDEILRETDVFVCPSVWNEAFGCVIAEAMGCGMPVIASRMGGIPELVEDGVTGILIPPARAEEMAKAISTLLQNNELALSMGRAGRKRAEEYFDIKMCVDKSIALYEECLAT